MEIFQIHYVQSKLFLNPFFAFLSKFSEKSKPVNSAPENYFTFFVKKPSP